VDIVIATSKVSDGSMLERHNPLDPKVIKNRQIFLQKHSITMDNATRLKVDTLHRATVLHESNWLRYISVTPKDKGQAMTDDDYATADALVTTDIGHALFLPVADCVAATFFDPVHHVLAVAHLGRHSLEQQGGQKIIEHLSEQYSTEPQHVKVWLSPAPGKDVYPIWALDNKGMKEVTFEQLRTAGIQRENIEDTDIETDKDTDYFSYTEFFNGRRSEDGDYSVVAMMTD
jgi:copper oxidase (laccase) domain-containing protein